jgi:hypothetical protein
MSVAGAGGTSSAASQGALNGYEGKLRAGQPEAGVTRQAAGYG